MVESMPSVKAIVSSGITKFLVDMDVNATTLKMLLEDERFASFKINKTASHEESKQELDDYMAMLTITENVQIDLRPLTPAFLRAFVFVAEFIELSYHKDKVYWRR